MSIPNPLKFFHWYTINNGPEKIMPSNTAYILFGISFVWLIILTYFVVRKK